MKLTKRKLIFLGVIILSFVAFLTLFPSQKNDVDYRTDIEPIISRFPMLKDIQKVYWSSKVIDNSFGPTSYWMRGYVFLDQISTLNIKNIYSWETVNINPKMEYDFMGETQNWSYSEEFNNFIKTSNYIGKFYLDLNGDLLYFEIEQ